MQKNLVFIQNIDQGKKELDQLPQIKSKTGLDILPCINIKDFNSYDLDDTVLIAYGNNYLY